MRALIIIGLVFSFAVCITAEQNEHFPPEPQNHPWHNYEWSNIPDAAGFIASPPKINEGVIDHAAIAPPANLWIEGPDVMIGTPPEHNVPLWGSDELVMAHGTPTLGTVNTNYDINENIVYVSLLIPHTGPDDTVYTYRSSDGGYTWNSFTMQCGSASTGGIRDHQVVLGTDASGTWFYSFCLYDDPGSMGGIWVLRLRSNGTGAQWTQIVVGGDSIANIAVDRNIETPEHLFIAFTTNINNLRLGSSSDESSTWGNWRYIDNSSSDCDVAAGGDGYVYITAAHDDTTDILIGRYTNNLISPSMNFEYINSSGEGDWTPTVAACRTSPGGSQTAWVLHRHRYSNMNANIRMGYTTNGGASAWTEQPWPPINYTHTTWNMRYPYARVSYDSDNIIRSVCTVREPSVPYDSLRYGFSRAISPATWEGEGVYNDYRITGEFGAVVDRNVDNSGGYVVYREYASANIWYDGYNFTTGVGEETTQPVNKMQFNASSLTRGNVRIEFTLPMHGNISLKAYDAAGRLVATIIDGAYDEGRHNHTWNANLSTGQYFLRLRTDRGAETQSVIVVK